MKAEEKAKELVEKMMLKMPPKIIPTAFGCDINLKGYTKNAIQCTIIAVDEILNEYPNQCPKDSFEMERYLYWKEVKNELEKL